MTQMSWPMVRVCMFFLGTVLCVMSCIVELQLRAAGAPTAYTVISRLVFSLPFFAFTFCIGEKAQKEEEEEAKRALEARYRRVRYYY